MDSYEPQNEKQIVAFAAFVALEESSSESLARIASTYSSDGLTGSLIFLDYPSIFSSLQDSETFFPYKGSYTSPPCFSNVTWLISTKSVFNISVADLLKIQGAQGFNSRDTQPLGASNLFEFPK
jgi:carbonic anhydrase